MSDPLSVQAAALAAVDRLIDLETRASAAPWRIDAGSIMAPDECVLYDADGHPPMEYTNVELLVALRNEAKAQTEGRYSILLRHAPYQCEDVSFEWWGCSGPCAGDPWPCEDWRDAAAGLPMDQELTGESDA